MEIALTIAVIAVHLLLLYRILVVAGLLWFLVCLFLPIVILFVVFRYWADLRGVFLTELVLVIARFALS